MTVELGLNAGLIITLVGFIVKYAMDYQKLRDKICHNHELFEIHRNDNEKEHRELNSVNKDVLDELKKLNEKITMLFERVPKREGDQ